MSLGQIVILNGTPRAGKSSIVTAIQDSYDGVWMNLGVDRFKAMTPARYQPGIGLRPGGERPDLEPLVVALYDALYQAIAAHSRLGINAVVDVGHHDSYSRSLGILASGAAKLAGLPAWLVGVHCPVEVLLQRRAQTWGTDPATDRERVQRWVEAVHTPGRYDLEVDTSVQSPEECAAAIRARLLDGPPKMLARLADGD